MQNYIKENELIFSLLNYSLYEGSHNIHSSSFEGIDYDYLLDQSTRHYIIPLIFQGITQNPSESHPPSFLEKLDILYKETVVRNLQLINELKSLNESFNSQGIDYVLIKGLGLGADLYNDIYLRQAGDLDLLVVKKDLKKAVDIMQGLGYEYYFELNRDQRSLYEKSSIYLKDHDIHFTFVHPNKSIVVELHWDLIPDNYSFSLDTELIFKQCREIKLQGIKINIMNASILLIYLSLHGSKHGWHPIRLICDIAKLKEKKSSRSFEEILNDAEKLNCRTQVLLSLSLSKQYFPDCDEKINFRSQSERIKIQKLVDTVKSNMFVLNDFNTMKKYEMKFFYSSMDCYSDKFKLLSGLIFKPTIYELEVINLPSYLSFLYYLIRPVRLLTKYSLRLVSG